MCERDVRECHLGIDAQYGFLGDAAVAAGVPVFEDGDAVVARGGLAERVAEGSGVAVAGLHAFFLSRNLIRRKKWRHCLMTSLMSLQLT